MQKLAKATSEVYSMNDGKAGLALSLNLRESLLKSILRTFVNSWQSTMKIHESMAENRIRFAQRLNEMSEDLATLVKEVDKNRKQVGFNLMHEFDDTEFCSCRRRNSPHVMNAAFKTQKQLPKKAKTDLISRQRSWSAFWWPKRARA